MGASPVASNSPLPNSGVGAPPGPTGAPTANSGVISGTLAVSQVCRKHPNPKAASICGLGYCAAAAFGATVAAATNATNG